MERSVATTCCEPAARNPVASESTSSTLFALDVAELQLDSTASDGACALAAISSAVTSRSQSLIVASLASLTVCPATCNTASPAAAHSATLVASDPILDAVCSSSATCAASRCAY